MNTSKENKYLKKEREKTDTSLKTERVKTDDTFETFELKTENATDQALEASRTSSDEARIVPANDAAINNERADADLAIRRERESKKTMLTALLNKERIETDTDLASERTRTDTDSMFFASQLSEEQIAHGLTKSALTSRDEFLAIVSHDLRNPIGTVLSCADMLLEDSAYLGINDEGRNWIQLIRRNASTALNLIADILDMERIARGKLQLNIGSHNINELIREAVQNFSRAAAGKSIILKVSVANNIEKTEFDKDRVAQVLSNLIGNSLKFTPEGGTIVVKSELLAESVKVSVADTGPGIPEEKMNNIFDRFTQLHKLDRRGLGLGLYISKMLVEAHEGQIGVSSTVGKGSTFTLTLPRTHSRANGLTN